MSAPSALHLDIIGAGEYQANTGLYPLNGADFIDAPTIEAIIQGQGGQYQLKLDAVNYDFCARSASGDVTTIPSTHTETVCEMPFSVAQ